MLRNGVKQYLLLVMLPNAFTALPNIMAGYFSLTGPSEANALHLSILMASSALLYISGIIFNDYFDIETDRKERPSRPLPSGQVPRRNALALAVATLAAANILAFFVSPASLAVSAALSAVLLAYDYRAKQGRLGPAAMGAARFLNVLLGASPALLYASATPWNTLLAASAMFAYVYSITLLSRKEAGEHEKSAQSKSVAQSFSIIAGVIALAAVLIAYRGPQMLANMALFSAVMLYTLRGVLSGKSPIQNAVRNLVLSIIILDSIFVTAFAGLYYGVATLAIMVPPVILAKKLYVT
jgi:4-hydroxybenzoate polyprenyltransferase